MSKFSFDDRLQSALDAQNALVPSTPQLDHAISNSKQQGLPHIAVGAGAGRFLAILCQLVNAKNILEIGALGGYSTIWLANSVPGVKVTSIEFDPKHHAVASENVKGLDNVEILLGAALEILPKIAERGTVFDFVFIDADWDNQANYFTEAVGLTRSGGIVFIDNALRMMTDEEIEVVDRKELIKRIQADTRVEATLVPAMNTEKSTLEEAFDGAIIAKVK